MAMHRGYVRQASEGANNELYGPDARPPREHPRDAPRERRRTGVDAWSGTPWSNLVALGIVIGTAATLHAHGITGIAAAQDAAAALRPIAGPFAEVVFAAGLSAPLPRGRDSLPPGN